MTSPALRILIIAATCLPAAPPVALAAHATEHVAQAQPRGAAKPPAKPAPKADLPLQELTPQLLYHYLLAEMALHRGQTQLAAQAYLDLARKTRDPRIARRATEVAFYSRQFPFAVEAATLWLQADPESPQARQTLATILVASGSLADVRPHLEAWLAGDAQHTAQAFLQINTLLARHNDKAAVATVVAELARPHAKLPEAQLAVAQAAWNANDAERALAAVRAALALRRDWELAALFQGQILQTRSNAEALAYFRDYLRDHPKARDVRLTYARLLVAENRIDDARREFGVLGSEFPDNADVALAVGLLALQSNDLVQAERSFLRVLELGHRDPDTVRFYLGQLAEERKRPDEALGWYRGVARGDQLIPAQTRIASILARQGKLAEARATLKGIEPQSLQQRVQLVQAEAFVLRESNAFQEAYDLLAQALEKMPNTPDLLYDFAMAAEKLNRLDVLETNLRKLIELRPDHAHAYNALGYTLADRTDRLTEAYDLIARALKLAPDDPFILDSMGWVLFRMGRVEESYPYLARAYKARPDPEIAAHYGEVLWAQGKRSEAERVWRGSLKEHPGNEVLLGVIKKFIP